MAHALPSGHVTTPRLPGTVALPRGHLPRCHLPLPPVLCLPVVLRRQARSQIVEVIVKYAQGKLTVAWGKCEEVLVVHTLMTHGTRRDRVKLKAGKEKLLTLGELHRPQTVPCLDRWRRRWMCWTHSQRYMGGKVEARGNKSFCKPLHINKTQD